MENSVTAHIFEILLLEDSPADVYLFRQALNLAGVVYKLTVIADGAEGIEFARRQGRYAETPIPDLAVLDLNLPKVSGSSVLEAMRQNKDLERVPVFIMSSSAEAHEQAIARDLGIERYITKPMNLEDYMQIGNVVKDSLTRNAA